MLDCPGTRLNLFWKLKTIDFSGIEIISGLTEIIGNLSPIARDLLAGME